MIRWSVIFSRADRSQNIKVALVDGKFVMPEINDNEIVICEIRKFWEEAKDDKIYQTKDLDFRSGNNWGHLVDDPSNNDFSEFLRRLKVSLQNYG